MNTEESKESKMLFTEEGIRNVFALVDLLKKIRARLQAEGVDLEKEKRAFDRNPNQSAEERITAASLKRYR